MTQEREIWVDGCLYHVVLSDERETLLAAKAAGRVIVGLLPSVGQGAGEQPEIKQGESLPVRYLTDDPAVEAQWLERVIRRERGLPWRITESERLFIREFTMGDLEQVMQEASDTPEDAVFYTPELLEAYIHGQYEFYECGMWALVRRCDGKLIGKAGAVMPDVADVSGEMVLELGYHVFEPFRRMGYAEEACRAILAYLRTEYGEKAVICARVRADHVPSIRLLEKLGFREEESREKDSSPERPGCHGSSEGACAAAMAQKYSGSGLLHFRYVL